MSPPVSSERQGQPDIENLLRVVRSHGVEVEPDVVDPLMFYCDTLREWNDRAGLVSPHDLPHLIRKHVALSLAPLLVVKPGAASHWIDVGTGGGLPGMVIKLCRPKLGMTLLDSSRKKTIFLEHLQEQLRIRFMVSNLRILEQRVEAHRSNDYDVILMRAVGALKKTLPLLNGIARPGVRLVTFKGERLSVELSEAEGTIKGVGWSVEGQQAIPWGRSTLVSLVRDAK